MHTNIPEIDSEPNWKPLEAVINPVQLDCFMHMGRAGTIQLYKHRDTRRYINIDEITGICFHFTHGEYTPCESESAIEYVFGEAN